MSARRARPGMPGVPTRAVPCLSSLKNAGTQPLLRRSASSPHAGRAPEEEQRRGAQSGKATQRGDATPHTAPTRGPTPNQRGTNTEPTWHQHRTNVAPRGMPSSRGFYFPLIRMAAPGICTYDRVTPQLCVRGCYGGDTTRSLPRPAAVGKHGRPRRLCSPRRSITGIPGNPPENITPSEREIPGGPALLSNSNTPPPLDSLGNPIQLSARGAGSVLPIRDRKLLVSLNQ